MLRHTKSPGSDVRLCVAACGNLVEHATFGITLGCSTSPPRTVGFLSSTVLGADMFPEHLPPTNNVYMEGKRMLDGSSWFDGVYSSFLLRVTIIRHLIKGTLNSGPKSARNENTVIHANLSGSTIDDLTAGAYLHPEMEEGTPGDPISFVKGHLDCVVVDGDLISTVPSQETYLDWKSICAVSPLHSSAIIAGMQSGDYDETWNNVYYHGLTSHGAHQLTFLATKVAHSWWGGYRGRYSTHKVAISVKATAKPTTLNNGTSTMQLTDLVDVKLIVQSSAVSTGMLFEGLSGTPSHSEIREMIDDLVPSMAALPLSVSDEISPTVVFLAQHSDVFANSTTDDLLSGVGYDPVRQIYNLTSTSAGETFEYFQRQALEALPNLIGGTYLSAVDALQNFLQSANTNYIETASELGSILDPVDVVKSFGTLRKLRPQDPADLVALLKLLGNANLAYQFGVVPTFSDAKETAKLVRRFQNELLGSVFRFQVARGKSYVELPDGTLPGVINCSVLMHTKARVRINPDGLLSGLITLEQMGALPSMSRIWDLVPYSWLADYLIDIGGILELADKQVLMLMVDVEYSVNSVLVLRPLSDLKSDWNFRTLQSDEPMYKLYSRQVLPGALPVLGPTSVPVFHTANASHLLSRWSILGSVVVQKL